MRSGAPVRKLKLASGGRGEVRHRVTAEIVVVAPEDIEDYRIAPASTALRDASAG